MSLRPGCMVRTICGQLVTSCLHLQKNRLKRPEIKQGRTSKVKCILFNRLLSKVLLNKSGLVRAKAGSFTLKTLNACFSNYYQVRTWPVFAWRVTYTYTEHYSDMNFFYIVCMVYACDDFSVIAMCMHC